jgi:eukaryotic-like serine/threonine-protein kinase
VWQLRNRLADGLAAAHAKGIIHRDIAPDNVILPEGSVQGAKLIDFGIAKRRDPAAGTIIGRIFAGKWGYVAPEQLGLFGVEVGPYSDIYSLGLVLAEAATGKPLDMGDSLETTIQARWQVPDLSQVPAELRP